MWNILETNLTTTEKTAEHTLEQNAKKPLTRRQIVQRAKKIAGWTNIKCTTVETNGNYTLTPVKKDLKHLSLTIEASAEEAAVEDETIEYAIAA